MKVFLFGNSGSGKTTLASKVKDQFDDYLSVDNFRMKYGDFTWLGEQKAVNMFIASIDKNKRNQLIECSGLGRTAERLRWAIPLIDDDVLIFILKCDPFTCSERNEFKPWFELKVPQMSIPEIKSQIHHYDYNTVKLAFGRYKQIVLDSSRPDMLDININIFKNNIL